MAPNIISVPTGVLHECDDEITSVVQEENEQKVPRRPAEVKLVWRNIIIFAYLHLIAAYGVYLMFTSAKILTTLYSILMYQLAGFGVTAGAHRLWSHRSYKAKWPLRLFLTICNTMAFENSVIEWARDHRVHHKYSETDADPHNAKRGFFFAHMGWLLCKKHPEVIRQGQKIDISDLYADPIIRFQHKYYMILMPLVCFVLPVPVPVLLWNETWLNSFCMNILRFIFTLHASWLVNSAAHMWGDRPYDKYINPSENLAVSILALGEGWHNYHHTFPWDYKAAELGQYSVNFSTCLIDMAAKIGWAYDLKSVSEDVVKKRVARTGDGTHLLWGWGDKDQPKEAYEVTTITYKKSD
ncbi:acyl-CoA Delta-9 desaturase-like [Anthonomus grandis grandis]|uniref:acyl-CoA Delta-9 desaturase-like n=1 Tax=Anthonomus grandis grandis TaxID=2921223 RepID=UPI002165F84C|nr:acyl-CoA Delta-9 desaturase-like [Anthonomus grandis grandis]XP_050308784.1 acyl-CoA Delta-9 desaturase-like [Anthonomus grandis grandis]